MHLNAISMSGRCIIVFQVSRTVFDDISTLSSIDCNTIIIINLFFHRKFTQYEIWIVKESILIYATHKMLYHYLITFIASRGTVRPSWDKQG